MQTIRNIVASIERKKTQLEYRLDYTKETLSDMDDEGRKSFESEIEDIEKKIAMYDFKIKEGQKAIEELSKIKKKINYLDDEIEKIAPYKGANNPKVVELRNESNSLEDKYSELYNDVLYKIEEL